MAKLRHRFSRRTAVLVGGGTIGVLVGGLLLVYFVFFPTSSPKPFKLRSTATTSSTTGANGSGTSSSAVAGKWTVAKGSAAGYRVREKLAFLPAQSDAVGRTSEISGSAEFSEANGKVTITTSSFKVNVSTLKSDKSMRDEKIHEIGLESNRYPTATFSLASPVTLAASEIEGKVARAMVTGTFTIHGTAKKKTIPVEMSLSGSTFEAVGALTFPWGDFGMTAPSLGGLVNVTDKATMEFDLHMQRV